MKKIARSFLAFSLLCTLGFSGGNVAPIVAPVITPVIDDSGFYAGAGLTYNRIYSVDSGWFDNSISTQDQTGGLTGIIGYDFNTYIAVEGRFTKTFWERDYSDTTIYSIFLKPQYRFRDAQSDNDKGYFAVYGLLGFGNSSVEGSSGDNSLSAWPEDIGREMMNETGFQWGVGLSYTFKDAVEDKPYHYKDSWTLFVDYTSSVKNASIAPTKLYNYDSDFYDKLSIDGITAGIIYNF